MTLYECQGNSAELEQLSKEGGQLCMGARSLPMACNSVVAAWARGSEVCCGLLNDTFDDFKTLPFSLFVNLKGFTFPPEAGFPLEPKQNKFFMLETHYSNLNAEFEPYQARRMTDSSGLKIVFTPDLRPHDAGVLSVGRWWYLLP